MKQEKKYFQIDVLPAESMETLSIKHNELFILKLYINGRCITAYTSKANIEALMYDKILIRDSKSLDSANVLNTSLTYELKPTI